MGHFPARRLLAIVVICLIPCGALIAQCADAEGKTRIRIAFVLPDLSNPFIAGLRDGAILEAERQNVDLLVKGTNDPAQQTNAFLTYVGAKVDAIGINAIDSRAIVPAVNRANVAGIPVIAIQAQPASGKLATFITAGNFKGGVLTGEAIAEYCKDKDPCEVGIVQGILADESGADEERGMRSVITAYPNVRIVSAQPTNYDPAKALNVATDMLTANPGLDYIYSWWDQGALAALEAARSKGVLGRIGISGFGGNCLNLAEVIKGNIYQESVFFPEYMGSLMVKSALDALRGKRLPAVTQAPILTLTTASANAVLEGIATAPEGLAIKQKLEAARAGKCSR